LGLKGLRSDEGDSEKCEAGRDGGASIKNDHRDLRIGEEVGQVKEASARKR